MATVALLRIEVNSTLFGSSIFAVNIQGVRTEFKRSIIAQANPTSTYYFYTKEDLERVARARFGSAVTVTRAGDVVTFTATDFGWSFDPVELGTFVGLEILENVEGTGESFQVPFTQTNVTVRGGNDGTIILSPQGGNAPYSYVWNDGGTGNTRNSLYAGVYTCVVTEASGVARTLLIVITEPQFSQITATAVITHAQCYGSATGSIVPTASGGDGVFTYKWADGPTTKNRTNVRAGTYTLTITDSSGNTGTVSFVVNQNNQIVIVATINENDVSLQVSGGIPGYTYLWQDGVTTKDRTNLPVGSYVVTVTDSIGCTQQATVRVQPFQFYFSKNPVPLYLAAQGVDSKPNLSFVCQVWIEKEYLSNTFTLIQTLEHPADSQGKTVFDVQSLLDAYLSPYLPEGVENEISRADSVFKRFYLAYTEKYGTPATEAGYTQADIKYVLLGGLSFEEYAKGTFFASYLSSKRPFFTWEPVGKRVFTDQPEYLFYMPDSFTLTQFTQVCKVYFTDGTTDTFPVGDRTATNRYELYCLPAGYSQLSLGSRQPSKTVSGWEIYVTDGTTAISEVRRYNLRADSPAQRRYFLYLNSLGGYNTLCATGKAQLSLEAKATELEKILQPDYKASTGEITTVKRYAENSFKLEVGYLDPEWLQAMSDFIISESVVMVRDGKYLGGKTTISSVKVVEEGGTDNSISFEFVMPKLNNYTPLL